MIILEGNLLNTPICLIAHQVNCLGVMGGGVAKQIKDKWNEVYEEYKSELALFKENAPLGLSFNIETKDKKHIIMNVFGQYYYGTDKKYTDYQALKRGMIYGICDYRELYGIDDNVQLPIAIPHGIGCGLAGGDWIVVRKLLEEIEQNENVIFIAYKL